MAQIICLRNGVLRLNSTVVEFTSDSRQQQIRDTVTLDSQQEVRCVPIAEGEELKSMYLVSLLNNLHVSALLIAGQGQAAFGGDYSQHCIASGSESKSMCFQE